MTAMMLVVVARVSLLPGRDSWVSCRVGEHPAAGSGVAAPSAPARTGRPADLAESQGFDWDPGLWRAVRASTGGVCDAAEAALRDGVSGSLSSGLHHARRGHGAGFCTVNGLAIAALRAADRGRRVLILDLDAHCGGGTHSLVARHPLITHVDVSTSAYDSYRPAPGNTLDVVPASVGYVATVEHRLTQVATAGFDLVLYNAGMDAHEHGGGGIPGITHGVLRARERLVFDWAARRRTPIAFVLAGGYLSAHLDVDGLVALHRLTIAAAAAVWTDLALGGAPVV